MREGVELADYQLATDVDADEYLTRREAAARCRVPLSTFDSLRRQARVPFPDARMGKHMLWRASTIDAFLGGGGTGVFS
ncbi:hypothetical protein [Microbacterium sp. BF1]|uniref:hypothetical protein n=1 Tax=Microbacterium sp. BF1 TaxID=2821146 RepID=UPI000D9357E5|nr:hypothetical protein [Microbacterium sp. BF1]